MSAITKNLNWQILTKNIDTFKRLDGLKMKNVNIMWIHQFLGEGGQIKGEYFGGGLGGWHLDAHYDQSLIHAGT